MTKHDQIKELLFEKLKAQCINKDYAARRVFELLDENNTFNLIDLLVIDLRIEPLEIDNAINEIKRIYGT